MERPMHSWHGQEGVQPSAPPEFGVVLPPPVPPRIKKSASADVSMLRQRYDAANSIQGVTVNTFGEAVQMSERRENLGSLSDLQGLDFTVGSRFNSLKDNKSKGLSSSEDNINSHCNEGTTNNVYPDIRAAFREVLPHPTQAFPNPPFQRFDGRINSNYSTASQSPYSTPFQLLHGTQSPFGPRPYPPGFILPGNNMSNFYPAQNLPSGGYPNQSMTTAPGQHDTALNMTSQYDYPQQNVYDSLQSTFLSPYPYQYSVSSDQASLSVSSGYTMPRPGSMNDLATFSNDQGDVYSTPAFIPSFSPFTLPKNNSQLNDDLIQLGSSGIEESEYLTLEAFDPLYQRIGEPNSGDMSTESNANSVSNSDNILSHGATTVQLTSQPGCNYEDILDVLTSDSSHPTTERHVDVDPYMHLNDVDHKTKPVKRQPPPRPPRPPSIRTSKMEGKNGDYERLHPITFVDEESQSFCAMVSELRGNFLSTDHESNMGLVLSSVRGFIPHETMTVKVVIHATFAKKIIPFTCDIDFLVEQVISQVLYSQHETTGALNASDYMLKVFDRSEYLLNMYPLSYYEYVHQCLKKDCDIKFLMFKRDQIDLPLLRTIDDDDQPVYFPRDFIQKDPGEVSRNSLDVLMETFYREVERLRDQTLTVKTEVSQCRSLTQSVKAVCAILAKIETMAISKSVNGIEEIVSKLSHRSSQPPDIDKCDDIYSDPSEIQDQNLAQRCSLLESLQGALDELIVNVQLLVNLYCQTFHTDFILFSKDYGYTETEVVTELVDNFLIHVASAHHIPVNWFYMYDEYCVNCSLHHSGNNLGKSILTKSKTISKSGLCEQVVFDEWIPFEDILLCSLPRESRLCLTFYGLKNVPSANTSTTNANTGTIKTALGGATVQLFDHKSRLVQGPQLVILRPGKEANPLGPSLISLLPDSVLLQVNLPEFGKHVIFPDVVETELKIQKTFVSLSTIDQEELKSILQKDCITCLTAEEKELLWDKRYHLLEDPAFLPKVISSAPGWNWACLPNIYILLGQWMTPQPAQAFELLMPQFADQRVREFAVICLRNLDIDLMIDFLPQLVQALKFESYHMSSLAELLLERACNSVRFAHDLFWLLKEAAQDSIYRQRYQLMFGAVMSVAGEALRKHFRKQEELMKILGRAAEKVKASRNKEMTLKTELETVYELFDQKRSILLPLDCSMEVFGIDLKSCSYFASNAFPLKLVFSNQNFHAEPIYTMFKVGDDLRQDMLTLQLIHIMDNLWLKEGLDLKMITFSVLSTGPNRGMVELVTESETLRKIQSGYGVTGSFKDRPIKDWLQKHNVTELDYQKAVDNFLRSCAGYCVATYVLGICDRHNDNIMLKQSGHMFHIDFGKFLGDSQMFGSFKRDRVPFVLTSDMVYVINGGERQSSLFQLFVELCCQAFNILRNNTNLFLSLFTLMSKSGIPGLSTNAATYVQTALLPEKSNSEATAFFTRMIDESLKSVFTQFNFFIHNLAQLKFSSHSEGALLSFVPKTYSILMDGKINSVEVLSCQKRYIPEKHYVYIIKVVREQHIVPSFIFRRFSEFVEFRDKLVAQFPLTTWHLLPTRLVLGRSHVKTVAESRKSEIDKFLKDLLLKAHEISGSDLVYTFFHPLLRDEQDVTDHTTNTGEVVVPDPDNLTVKGQVKLSIHYKKDVLSVMIMHAKDLGCTQAVAPSPYVKTYLLPDPFKETKRKTKVVKNTNHPVYNEILLYKTSRDEARNKVLQVTIWDHDLLRENEFMGAVFIKLRELNLSQETIKWYPLGNLQVSISDMLA